MHPRDHSCRRHLRHDDEEGVDEDDDTDPNRPDRCVRRRKRREDVGEERTADHHESEVARDQGEQEPIATDRSEASCAVARRRSMREAGVRDPDEHEQREGDEGDGVEEVETLERPEIMGGGDDEAGDCRAESETEVSSDSTERGRCGALLRRDEGQGQDLAGGTYESEAGTRDGGADKALPRMLDKRQDPVADRVQDSAGNQEAFRTEAIEKRTRRERYDCGSAHDRRQHESRGCCREATDRVEVDDLERQDQSRAEVVEGVPALQDEERSRSIGAPNADEACECVAHGRADTALARNWARPLQISSVSVCVDHRWRPRGQRCEDGQWRSSS